MKKIIESSFGELLELTKTLFYLHDLEGKFLFLNQGAVEFLGYGKETLLRMNVRDILVPEMRDRFDNYLSEIKEKRGSRGLMSIQTASGDKRIIAYENILSKRMNGGWVVSGVAHDVTDLIETKRRLKQLSQQLSLILESMPIVSYTLSGEGDYLPSFITHNVKEVTGFDHKDFMGKPLFCPEQIHPEDCPKILTNLPQLFKKGYQEYQYRRKVADGSYQWFYDHLRIIESSDGKKYIIGMMQDITEKKKIEESLLHSAQQWRTTFDSIHDFVSLLDLDGRILRCNKAMKDFLKKPFHEIINRSCWETILGTSEPIENCPFLRMKETLQRETTILSMNDRWFNVSVDPILDHSGNLIGAVSLLSDITDQKRAEERMRSLQEQLLQSQKMEAIGQLAGGVAHDFNNLLTVINGYSDLILEELDKKSRIFQDMREIKKATEHAASLTRQLLAFSRRQVLQPKILDINSLIQNIEKMLRRMIGEDIQLMTILSKDLGRVKADPGQIEQVIFNLVVNSRDAMPQGGRITIHTENVEWDESFTRSYIDAIPGRYVMISISDDGMGMSKEVMEHIFEPFFTTKEKGKGTGLGLSTVYGIVKQSGGNIWMDSEPGKGTTFKIYLPQLEEDGKSIEPVDSSGKSYPGSETILLVEDEESVRKVARTILGKNGYTILEATRGDEALRLLEESNSRPIHLLITDLVMPGMNGVDLADQLRLKRPEMKVLFMSGYTDNPIIHHEILKGGRPYIQKPFTINTLTQKVREVLDGRFDSS